MSARVAGPIKYWSVSPKKRQDVKERDGFACVACGSEESLSIDHVLPRALGGSDDMSNLQTLCRWCNTSKGTKTMDEWMASR